MGKQLIMAYYIKNWKPYINSIIYKFWISPIWVTYIVISDQCLPKNH